MTSFLAAAQLDSGGWGVYPPPNTNPPNANSTALAVGGLRAIGGDPDGLPFQGGVGALQSLLGFQNIEWRIRLHSAAEREDNLLATLDSLTALARPLAPPAACKPIYLPALLRTP